MKSGLMAALAAALALGGAGAAAAQEIDWNSEANRTWWNGVTGAEIRELVAESGGVFVDLPDTDTVRVGRIDWPDVGSVMIREYHCPAPERPMEERNCGAMLLSVAVDEPADVEDWWLATDGWLAFGRVDNAPALYRIDHHGLGTTRGHVLGTLVLFRLGAVTEINRMAELRGAR